MAEKIVINPITRISGFLEITAYIENNKIIDAESSGLLFRGFEKMLKGRSPLDAMYFTERICGICSTAHSLVSVKALEAAYNIKPNKNELLLQDILHGCEFLQNHLRHFFQYTIPDFVNGFDINPLYSIQHNDFRIPEKQSVRLREDYFISLNYSKKAHEALAVLGGKAPHNHGMFVGGVTVQITAQKIQQVRSLITDIREFIRSRMIEDIYIIAEYYKEYFNNGSGYENLMSYGLYDSYETGTRYVSPGVIIGGGQESFNPSNIYENIYSAWYRANNETLSPKEDEEWETDLKKSTAYSWIKAPRYNGNPMEVGPLARMYISGRYREGISTMNRYIARVLEAELISEIIIELLDELTLEPVTKKDYKLPENAMGQGLNDTTRGALGHWINIEKGSIKNYTIITPSTWNLSSKDSKGVRGPVEKALIGTYINNPKNPVEIGRIVRSFDPCVSCATHVLSNNVSTVNIRSV